MCSCLQDQTLSTTDDDSNLFLNQYFSQERLKVILIAGLGNVRCLISSLRDPDSTG